MTSPVVHIERWVKCCFLKQSSSYIGNISSAKRTSSKLFINLSRCDTVISALVTSRLSWAGVEGYQLIRGELKLYPKNQSFFVWSEIRVHTSG